ncbi:hypothetical protein KAJ27_21380 [bacterium]|nr:hypothetical protein [bacterium]
MELKEYYKRIFPKLDNAFHRSHFALGYGLELLQYGWDPSGLHVIVEPTDQLYKFACEMGLEVFIPILGCKNDIDGSVEQVESILIPFDFEIYLQDHSKLYANPGSQLFFFKNHIKPVKEYLESFFTKHNIPHMLDYTPSGGHFLTYVNRGTSAWNALRDIGYEDQSVIDAYNYHDLDDLKRNPEPGEETALVYSGICMIAEYLAIKTKQDVDTGDCPVTLWDSAEKCVNIDISWTADPAFMRIIRSPFSAHKKKSQKYGFGPEPLVDVIGRYYDGHTDVNCQDLDWIIDCMWDMDKAIEHANNFSGFIPWADEGLVQLVEEYKNSPLKVHHDYCHYGEHDLEPGEAEHRCRNDTNLHSKTKNVIQHPYPRMLQPRTMKLFIRDLYNNGWHPRHIKNLMADKYRDQFFKWGINWDKYHPDKKAWAFSRQYSSVAMIEQGWKI